MPWFLTKLDYVSIIFLMKMNSKDYWIMGAITLVIFTGTYTVLSIFGLMPKQFTYVDIKNTEPNTKPVNYLDNEDSENILYPDKITIPEIGVNTVVQKPDSPDIQVLDEALEKGAVYYPGSGTINQGNMFLFGHSAEFYNTVTNPAYRAFDGLSKLQIGDEIEIISNGRKFVYKVSSVNLVDESTAFVDFSRTERMLTLSTCDTFGRLQDRWVVEAQFDKEV